MADIESPDITRSHSLHSARRHNSRNDSLVQEIIPWSVTWILTHRSNLQNITLVIYLLIDTYIDTYVYSLNKERFPSMLVKFKSLLPDISQSWLFIKCFVPIQTRTEGCLGLNLNFKWKNFVKSMFTELREYPRTVSNDRSLFIWTKKVRSSQIVSGEYNNLIFFTQSWFFDVWNSAHI